MTPPGPEAVDAALAALTGTVSETKPGNDLERNLMRLRLVMEAQQRGVSWSAIGHTMKCSGKEAKRQMKQLARHTQRQLFLARNG